MKMNYFRQINGCMTKISLGLSAIILAACVPALAQLSPTEPDPLARIRDAAKSNVAACSATGETLCEQVAPKIVANAEGDSPLIANLQRLSEMVKHQAGPSFVPWAVAAFHDANVDVHTEKYVLPKWPITGPQEAEYVVAEIRGREKPDEWVLLGAETGAYNAAMLIEAARDIQLTGIHPRRSIRFVLFVPGDVGSIHYLQVHRNELDRASAAIILSADANPLTGFILNGRQDIAAAVRDALEPMHGMGVTHHNFDAPFDKFSLGFILEGIPTLLAQPVEPDHHHSSSDQVDMRSPDNAQIQQVKRNTAIAAVTAFGIAERAEAIGPRQSRAEIESLLKDTGLDKEMKEHGLWPLWESGQRGRLP
jgi:hypothetical protein